MIYIAIYYAVINIYLLLLMGIDKRRAVLHKFRIKEATLFLCSALGGSLGGLLGMKIFRHKTNKLKFHIIYWFFLIIHIVLISFIIFNIKAVYQ